MTTEEKYAIQYMIWRHASGIANAGKDGFKLSSRKTNWTLLRLKTLWYKYCEENDI